MKHRVRTRTRHGHWNVKIDNNLKKMTIQCNQMCPRRVGVGNLHVLDTG